MKIGLMLFLLIPIFAACSKMKGKDTTEVAVDQKYHCPMHPTYISDKPGDCPICGMRLVPIEPEQSSEKKIAFYRNPMNPKITSPVPMKDEMGMDYVPVYEDDSSVTSVDGQATVKIDPSRQQLIGVATTKIEVRDLTKAIRSSARVAYDPNLYSAILEHQQTLTTSPSPALVHASEMRLRQMGLSDHQIKEVSRPGFDASNLLLSQSGGKVWIYIDIYEFEASLVKAGQKVDLTASASPGKIYRGTIRSVDRVVNSETRTLRARAEAVNIDGMLRPEMYLDAVIHVPTGRKLSIPASAIIDTGTRQLTYVEKSPGEFEPRVVTLGAKSEDYYEVIAGVQEGESVVSSANFLIDSESKLKSATGKK